MTVPKIICLCGSARFTDAVYKAYANEALKGNLVLTYLPERVFTSRMWHSDTVLKTALDTLHLQRIDLANEILVLNVEGYIGKSTSNEIKYAKSIGKQIRYLED